jgi:hypothetical protein
LSRKRWLLAGTVCLAIVLASTCGVAAYNNNVKPHTLAVRNESSDVIRIDGMDLAAHGDGYAELLPNTSGTFDTGWFKSEPILITIYGAGLRGEQTLQATNCNWRDVKSHQPLVITQAGVSCSPVPNPFFGTTHRE